MKLGTINELGKSHVVVKVDDEFERVKCNTHPHNYYLEIMSDIGLVGLSLVLVIFASVIYKSFVRISSANLVNLITKSNHVPEFLFGRCNSKNFYTQAKLLLDNKSQSEAQLISSKQAIRELGYGSIDPSIRAAKSIKKFLKL